MNLPFHSKLVMKFAIFIIFIISLFVAVEKFKDSFPIKTVKVFGVQHSDLGTMQEMLTPLVHKGFFAIDVETIKDHLLESPWVLKANVRRVWPGQVIVTIVEKKPIARWNQSGLLSANGEVFSPDIKSYPDNLPQFIGRDTQYMQILEYYHKLSTVLVPLHFKISRLELTPDFSWHITFNNGIKLSANHQDILTRMSHFVKVCPKIIGNRFAAVDHIDLRYQNGLAVRWKATTSIG